MKNSNIMLDLETLGNRPGAIIKAIGAVRFNEAGISSSFYEHIEVKSAVAAGLTVDVDTVMWWLAQGDEARREMLTPGVYIASVLGRFAMWMAEAGPETDVWGNGAGFDNVLLSVAYERCNLPVPWKFWNDRCYRTMKNISSVPAPKMAGVKHNALDDATAQALHLIEIFKSLRGPVDTFKDGTPHPGPLPKVEREPLLSPEF